MAKGGERAPWISISAPDMMRASRRFSLPAKNLAAPTFCFPEAAEEEHLIHLPMSPPRQTVEHQDWDRIYLESSVGPSLNSTSPAMSRCQAMNGMASPTCSIRTDQSGASQEAEEGLSCTEAELRMIRRRKKIEHRYRKQISGWTGSSGRNRAPNRSSSSLSESDMKVDPASKSEPCFKSDQCLDEGRNLSPLTPMTPPAIGKVASTEAVTASRRVPSSGRASIEHRHEMAHQHQEEDCPKCARRRMTCGETLSSIAGAPSVSSHSSEYSEARLQRQSTRILLKMDFLDSNFELPIYLFMSFVFLCTIAKLAIEGQSRVQA